jgi:hypothetical protein
LPNTKSLFPSLNALASPTWMHGRPPLRGSGLPMPVQWRQSQLNKPVIGCMSVDNPLGAQPAAVAPRFESVRNCQIREEANGLLMNVATRQPFTYGDACVEHGPHLGYDPVAAQAAKKAVNEFLKAIFALD